MQTISKMNLIPPAIKPVQQHANTSNGKVQRLMTKFDSGRKLSPQEIGYLAVNKAADLGRIHRITAERARFELSMRALPTKLDVSLLAIQAMHTIKTTSTGAEDDLVRLNHMQDAMNEYQKTDHYKRKPEHYSDLFDNKKKKKHTAPVKPAAPLWTTAIDAYTRVQGSAVR